VSTKQVPERSVVVPPTRKTKNKRKKIHNNQRKSSTKESNRKGNDHLDAHVEEFPKRTGEAALDLPLIRNKNIYKRPVIEMKGGTEENIDDE
jgi:hypothetical protein